MFRRLIMKSKEYKRLEHSLEITTKELDNTLRLLHKCQIKLDRELEKRSKDLISNVYGIQMNKLEGH